MKETSPINLEMSIALPLGVVGQQLMRIEADLRSLNMKALDFAAERDMAPDVRHIDARLEQINEALDSIKVLVADIAAELHPARSKDKRRADLDD
jgi:hypothetical protein